MIGRPGINSSSATIRSNHRRKTKYFGTTICSISVAVGSIDHSTVSLPMVSFMKGSVLSVVSALAVVSPEEPEAVLSAVPDSLGEAVSLNEAISLPAAVAEISSWEADCPASSDFTSSDFNGVSDWLFIVSVVTSAPVASTSTPPLVPSAREVPSAGETVAAVLFFAVPVPCPSRNRVEAEIAVSSAGSNARSSLPNFAGAVDIALFA